MPTYNFKNKKTGDQWQEMMSNSEREKLLNDNPDIIQLLINPVSLGDPVTLGFKKPDDSFRDVLKEIKKHHPRGGGINTF